MTLFTFQGITETYVANLSQRFRGSLSNPTPAEAKALVLSRINMLVDSIGRKLYVVHSYENGEGFRNVQYPPAPGASPFEQRFPTAAEFVAAKEGRTPEQYDQLVTSSRRNQAEETLRNANLGRRLPNCLGIQASIFASFIGSEGQRLRAVSVPGPWASGWWQDLVWSNTDQQLAMPILCTGSPGHGTNAVFVGPTWNDDERRNITNYFFFDAFGVPEGMTGGINEDIPGSIGNENTNVVELYMLDSLDLPWGSNPGAVRFFFARSHSSQPWVYQAQEPALVEHPEGSQSFRYEVDRQYY